ncbi:MAG: hypothetical protein NC310_07360 [Roseburia sp.]|nr:hypothetical protein [Anaeroplasma bactoclasticum]MCM1196867.1 hypothetical protein [Roseburia sp.]MCM1556495.1 hypothetical protein [Anaeroplasma bactoclasticum]
MNLEGYILDIIKKIEEKGHSAYLAGTSVFMHILGRPIEEYDIITSAPFFSLSKKEKQEDNILHIDSYTKKVHISFSLNKEDYYKECCLNIDTLLYHYKHGIIDEKHTLDDIDKKKIKILNPTILNQHKENLFKALLYAVSYDFKFDKHLEEYLSNHTFDFSNVKKNEIGKYLIRILTLSAPGKTILKYKSIFSNFIKVSDTLIKALDYTKNDLTLRLLVLCNALDIISAEKFLREYAFPKEVKSTVLHLLEIQDRLPSLNDLEEFISKVSKKEARILFSLKRSYHLASNQISKIKELDATENKINSLYD